VVYWHLMRGQVMRETVRGRVGSCLTINAGFSANAVCGGTLHGVSYTLTRPA
jgi:hypothetical protein